nr:hypothetical protein [Crocinitomicaceae bacterium]
MSSTKVVKLLGSLLLLIGCISSGTSLKGVEPEAYIHYYKAHQEEFKKVQSNGVAVYSFAYLPKELMLIQAIKNKQLTNDEVTNWMKEKE